MLPFLLRRHMKFEDYYKEFCEVFGHPLWMLPMMMIGLFFMIEVLHFREHKNIEGDAHGYCGQQEFVKELTSCLEMNRKIDIVTSSIDNDKIHFLGYPYRITDKEHEGFLIHLYKEN